MKAKSKNPKQKVMTDREYRRVSLVRMVAERDWFAAAFDKTGQRKKQVRKMEHDLMKLSDAELLNTLNQRSYSKMANRYKGTALGPVEKAIRETDNKLKAQLRAERKEEIARLRDEANNRKVRARKTKAPVYNLEFLAKTVPELIVRPMMNAD